MVRNSALFIGMGLIAGTGCTQASDNDTTSGFDTIEDQKGSCELIEELALGVDEESPITLSGDDILLRAEGQHLSTLSYPDQASLQVGVNVTYSSGDVTFYDRDVVGTPDLEVAEGCFDTLEVAVVVDIVSDDGVFNELAIPVHLIGIVENESSWTATIDPDNLGGTYEVTEVDPAAYDDVQLLLEGTFVTQGSGGVITGLATSGDLVDEFEVAQWVPPGQEG